MRTVNGAVERYHHVAHRLLSSQGVENGSEVRVELDPTYQHLVLHTVAIHRAGRRIDALDPREVKLIQREPELDRRLFDGRITAVLFLKDVRRGDVVEAAWSVRGANPVFGGRWAGRFSLAYSVPVARLQVRVLAPARARWRTGWRGPSSPRRRRGGARSSTAGGASPTCPPSRARTSSRPARSSSPTSRSLSGRGGRRCRNGRRRSTSPARSPGRRWRASRAGGRCPTRRRAPRRRSASSRTRSGTWASSTAPARTGRTRPRRCWRAASATARTSPCSSSRS